MPTPPSITLHPAHSPPLLNHIHTLFLEYAESLNFDLCFQDFDQELAGLPWHYAPPMGALLLATINDQPAGCIALKPITPPNTPPNNPTDLSDCEMKRLYVRPDFRGHNLGRTLATTIIDAARTIGYRRMLLDTVPTMAAAIALYESLGFRDATPYRDNPIPGTRFLALNLHEHARPSADPEPNTSSPSSPPHSPPTS